MNSPSDVGERIERLLDTLEVAIIPREFERVTEVLRLVTELYGAALGRIMELVPETVSHELIADELVAGMLIVHGLHPESLEARVEEALASVRPFLAHHNGDVELLALDPEAGAVQIRLLGSCDGCPSSSVTLQMAVEKAIHEAAPEIGIIDAVSGGDAAASGAEVTVSLGRKPLYEECPVPVGSS